MKVMNVLHMNNGEGDTSYTKNSTVQEKIIFVAKPVKEQAVEGLMLSKLGVPESIGIADLGCSSGANSLTVLTEIIETVYAKCSELGCLLPEFRVSFNDLPSNDFNEIFMLLPEYYKKIKAQKDEFPCYICAMPGSFDGRLFPNNSLHFVHFSSSLNWLSQIIGKTTFLVLEHLQQPLQPLWDAQIGELHQKNFLQKPLQPQSSNLQPHSLFSEMVS